MFAIGALDHRRRGAIGDAAPPLLLVASLVTALMIGLRYEVGGDWEPYREIFAYARFINLKNTLAMGDPGYALLNWTAHRLDVGLWAVNVVCGFIFAWGLHKFARRQPNPWLAMLVAVPYLIIVVAMGYSRQAVAIGFMLAGLAELDRRSLPRFIFYIALATTFHKTAVIVLPLVALAAVRNRIIVVGLTVTIGVILYYLFLEATLQLLYTNYVESEYSSEGAAIRVVLNVVPAILFLIFNRKFNLAEDRRKLWRNFSLAALGTLVLLFVLRSSTVIDRLALYLIPLQIFVLARLPEAFPNKGRANGQLVLAVLLYSAALQFTWLNFADHADSWLPFRFYPLFGD